VAGYPPGSWGRTRVELFAVEPTAVQLTWVALAPGPVRVRVGDRSLVADSDGGPGGVVVEGLSPATRHRIAVESAPKGSRRIGAESAPRHWRFDVTTPGAPQGEELFRLATVSDIHIGLDHFGLSRRMRERTPTDPPHAYRCAAAALAEATAWGAQYIVVKGDLVERSRPEEWESADRLLAATGLPTAFVPGNHEVKHDRPMDAPSPLPESGVEIVDHVVHHDLPGVRLVLVNCTIDGRGHGAVDHLVDDVTDAAAGTDLPVLVAMHQHPQRFELPWFWPPGIPGREGRRFIDAVGRANPRALVTSGHTHRNRAHRRGPVTHTEVGSTKDFPGVWGGYTVYEGGIAQTVRRTLAPQAMGWTEYTRRAVLGVWGRWSIGSLTDRCLVLNW
jgi:3',5'-cyclic-AMP phosphodiesterase